MLELDRLALAQGGFRLEADLALEAGGTVAVIGPSGGGKSTLLAGIAGFLAPQAGRVRWAGRDLTGLVPGARPVSVLFQDGNLFPHLTVAQNVGLALGPRLRLPAEDRDRVEGALARVGLSGRGGDRPAQLSGGQQGRAALARVLLSGRPVVLLDEAFAALGPALKDEMLDLVAGLVAGPERLVLMVSHDPGDATRIAARTVLVAEGRATGPFDTADLLADPPPALAAYLRAPDRS
ncbi:ATP-binding cassette domain-containing protein [Wenxinia saemankumensis]|uniref:Thiamine transport system ATP-binding protein n=1 Tax=Wenxinia saemankumensis TaxID=1447782 RepID=A0A1M6FNW2_9RHOB|nr:ATP-binding cassette domain-containing protein [Wenxinia saemankumensis]SHI99366.1 thiamine transport system ATP-binding protein [Wenxinia saemankumensis]